MSCWQEINVRVLQRDGCQCQSCGKRPAGQVFPSEANGMDEIARLVTLCGRCHMLASSVPDWLATKVWKISMANLPLERRIVEGRIKRKIAILSRS